MISLYTIVTFSLIHWIFDFHLQTEKMAQNKSTDNTTLLGHCLVYYVGLALMCVFNYGAMSARVWVLFIWGNFAAHFLTDWITSRATSALYKEGRLHDFFVVYGADQMIHHATLFGSLVWLQSL